MTDAKKPEAIRLAECLERDCAMNWPDYDNQMDSAAELRRLHARVVELETRLEIDPRHPYDGIACRDATIAELEAQAPAVPAEITPELLDRALMALLQCSHSDLESYSPLMLAGYTDDVKRVIEAIGYRAAPQPSSQAPAVPAVPSQCDSPEICRINGGCAGQYETQRMCQKSAPQREVPAQCTNSDSWNCKYCRKNKVCDAFGNCGERPRAAPEAPNAYPMTGNESEADLGPWQHGTAKPTLDGTYLREFDEGDGTSEFCEGVWLRDGFFPSDIQDTRWRGRAAAPQPEAQAPAVPAGVLTAIRAAGMHMLRGVDDVYLLVPAMGATAQAAPQPEAAVDEAMRKDAERWRTFISLPYAIRAEWASNLSATPVLTQWVDQATADAALAAQGDKP